MYKPPQWGVAVTDEAAKEIHKCVAKHPRETASVNDNLRRVFEQLRSGKRLASFKFGFFRSEGDGLYRIGQTGVPGARETRLYIFPDEASSTVFVLGMGDKDMQQRDIKHAKEMIRDIRGNK
jgi:putative component of toxin-antitoxin plasmid stabilization module